MDLVIATMTVAGVVLTTVLAIYAAFVLDELTHEREAQVREKEHKRLVSEYEERLSRERDSNMCHLADYHLRRGGE